MNTKYQTTVLLTVTKCSITYYITNVRAMLIVTSFLVYDVDMNAQQNVRNIVCSTIKETELTQ